MAAKKPRAPELPNEVYRTRLGSAHHGDALNLLPLLPAASVQLILTSPPFALLTKKSYGNEPEHKYVEWFEKFANEFKRVLRDDGSLIIDIGGSWNPGVPTRSVYHFELVVALVREHGFHLAQEFFWFNKAKLPSPAAWVTVRRTRVKDAVNPVWWLSKTETPKADNRRVLRPYSKSMKQILRSQRYNRGRRPSGHVVGDGFLKDNGGSIPPNLIEVANTRHGDAYQAHWRQTDPKKMHPARFPPEVPEFFVRFLTDENDLVLDPFSGSNMTGAVAESLGRRWLAMEIDRSYAEGSIQRFDPGTVTKNKTRFKK